MLYRNFILAKRLFLKYPLNSIITLSGLTLGLAAFLILFLYIYDEHQADRFHENYESIYQINMTHYVNGEPTFTFPPPAGFKQDLNNISEIASNTRAKTAGEVVFEANGNRFYEKGGVYIDSSWLEVFDFEYAFSSFEFATDPARIAISGSMANKYFGQSDPIGKIVKIDGEEYIVDNIILAPRSNYSLYPNFLISYEKQSQFGVLLDDYKAGHTPYWIVVNDISEEQLRDKLQQIIDDKVGDSEKVELQRFDEYYFNQDAYYGSNQVSVRGNEKFYQVFIWVAIIILLLAVINYINLNTARATDRAKEVGIKKTIGAGNGKLISQFLVESVSITLLAGLLAIGLTELCLPLVNHFIGVPINQVFISNLPFIAAYFCLLIMIGILAGFYPALVLSSFKPSLMLKGRVERRGGKNWLSNSLSAFQFTIAAVLIFSCLVINRQMNFLTNYDLGVDSEQIISIKASDEVKGALPAFKQDLLNLSGIYNVATGNLSKIGWMYGAEVNGKTASVAIHHVDENFIETAGIKLVEGRDFKMGDDKNKVIINQTLRDIYFGDQKTSFGESPGVNGFLIGVVENFHITSAAREVLPLEIKLDPEKSMNALVRVEQGVHLQDLLADIERIHGKYAPNSVFEYHFLDDQYNAQFKSEMMFLELLNYFTYLSVFIAFIGLFGLGQFSFLKKVKELGIRKVLGASSISISKLLIYQLFKPVIIALIISLPLAYFLLDSWLEAYSNKVTLSWQFGAFTVIVMLLIALVAIFYQLLNAVRLKSVNVLKDE